MNSINQFFQNRVNLADFCQKNQVSYLGLFGSFARGEEKKESDVDILIDFEDIKSFFEMASIKLDLEKRLKKEVDLTMKSNLKPSIKPYVFKDLISLYEKG
jgi:predicted nucleotidyltransferase